MRKPGPAWKSSLAWLLTLGCSVQGIGYNGLSGEPLGQVTTMMLLVFGA